MTDVKPHQQAGCLVVSFGVLIVSPLWYAVMVWTLMKLEAPVWVWVAFWLYVPLGLAVGIARGILELFRGD